MESQISALYWPLQERSFWDAMLYIQLLTQLTHLMHDLGETQGIDAFCFRMHIFVLSLCRYIFYFRFSVVFIRISLTYLQDGCWGYWPCQVLKNVAASQPNQQRYSGPVMYYFRTEHSKLQHVDAKAQKQHTQADDLFFFLSQGG